VPAPVVRETIDTDPLVARTLHDPLLVDPDLAYRNEANALLTIRHDQPLPLFTAREDVAARAREAARLKLLQGGEISDLPEAFGDAPHASIADITRAEDMITAVGGPSNCSARLRESLRWAAGMPEAAEIMPHGMVQRAAGVDSADCKVRIVRYLTPATANDALQYHVTKAERDRMRVVRYLAPEAILIAQSRTQRMVVHVRPSAGGMQAVDLIYWTV
jgi:hypothetical protein